MYPHARREQRGTRLVDSEKESAGRLVQEVQTHFASYVRGGVQQTGPSARLGHTPPGVHKAGSARLDRRSEMDWRHQKERANARESCDLRSNKFRGPGGQAHVRIDVNSPELVRKYAKLLFANV